MTGSVSRANGNPFNDFNPSVSSKSSKDDKAKDIQEKSKGALDFADNQAGAINLALLDGTFNVSLLMNVLRALQEKSANQRTNENKKLDATIENRRSDELIEDQNINKENAKATSIQAAGQIFNAGSKMAGCVTDVAGGSQAWGLGFNALGSGLEAAGTAAAGQVTLGANNRKNINDFEEQDTGKYTQTLDQNENRTRDDGEEWVQANNQINQALIQQEQAEMLK